jgi:transposase
VRVAKYWGMARSYRPVDRDQQFLMPPSLREWLPADHLVWFVLEVVEELDTSGFHAGHPKVGPGRRAYDPDLLLAVLVYGYAVGERSSRRIESLCREHVAFQVLCGRDVPDHTVISRFRAAHEDQFAEVFAQVLVLCGRAGMVKVGTVAIDGTKIAANASIFANRAEESLRAEAQRIARQIAAEAAAVDAAEDELYGDARGDELAPEFADPATRSAAIKAALAEIEKEKAKQAEEAAGEAERRAQGWQARATARREELAIAEREAAERVTAWEAAQEAARTQGTRRPGGRRPQLESWQVRKLRNQLAVLERRAATAAPKPRTSQPRAGARKANLTDPESRVMNTRTGWVQGYNAQLAVTADHLILALMLTQEPTDMGCLQPMMTAAQAASATLTQHHEHTDQHTQEIAMVLADAGYCSEDNLTAPGPDRLIATGKDRRLTDEATSDPRIGPAPAEAGPVEQMRHRLRTPEGLAAYKQRGALVEPVNAHLKDQIGLRRFSRRGLTAAASELNLAAAVTNLLKLHRHTTAPAT